MRLDKFLAENFGSRTKAAFAIRKGLVLVNGKPAEPSCEYRENDKIEILTAAESYVSVGGFKLSKALKDFNFSVNGKVFCRHRGEYRRLYRLSFTKRGEKSLLHRRGGKPVR